jgi:hypothetical protein
MNPSSLIHDAGIGDFFQVESSWSDERRAALRAVYYPFDCPASRAMRGAIEANPAYAHVDHRRLGYPTQPIPDSTTALRESGALSHRTFHGSSFLTNALDCPDPGELPDSFVFIHGSTPFNSASIRARRDLTPPEWGAIVDRLEARDEVGLVVNSAGATHPGHPRLVDHSGRTTIAQAIEILKRADGYVGIDSCFAILAAQLFKPEDLVIRTRNPWVVAQAWWHYPPHETFPFLVPTVGGPPHPIGDRPIPGVEVELRCNTSVGGRTFGPGDLVDLPPDRAGRLISEGLAAKPRS